MEQVAEVDFLKSWAGAFHGFPSTAVERGARIMDGIAPPWATATDRTLLGRWLAVAEWLNDYSQGDMALPLDRAVMFWRGLRAVAEGRAAPTSPFGAAISDVLTNLSHLTNIQQSDISFMGVAISDWVDGLAARYQWRQSAAIPPMSAYLVAAPRTSSSLALYALVSASRHWRLGELLPTSNVRKLLPSVGTALCLLHDLALDHDPSANPITAVRVMAAAVENRQIARERVQSLLNQVLTDIHTSLTALPSRWREFGDWTRSLLQGTQQLYASVDPALDILRSQPIE